MKAMRICSFVTATCVSAVYAADDGHTELFRAVSDNLSMRDQRAIYSSLQLKLDTKKKTFILDGCDGVTFDVELRDLNNDGITEVFLVGGNTCTSGHTGSSIWLFIKAPYGAYRMNLGFPAAAYEILRVQNKGFPDLQFAGPGFCEAIWRWGGTAYAHFKNIPTRKDGCDR